MSADSCQRAHIANWNATAGVWETSESLLCGHSELYSETWPSWGMTQGGVAFALSTPAPPMDGSASSSSPNLPTPTARDFKNVGDPDKTAGRMALRGQPLGEVVVNHLPTA